MAAVLNSTQAARSAAGWRSATSTTSSGIATMRDSVSRFGRSVSIARTLDAWRAQREGERQTNCHGTEIVSAGSRRYLQRNDEPTGDQHVRSHRRDTSRATEPQHQAARGGPASSSLALLAVGVGYTLYGLLADIDAAHTPPVAIGAFVLLGIALLIALGFEFVNGFHDTANAVATVIYTHSLPPHLAVVWSGAFNFLGVMVSSRRGRLQRAVACCRWS